MSSTPRILATVVALALGLTGLSAPAQAATLGGDGKPITNAAGVTFGVQAHRAGADEHPQNSLEAINYSVAQGFDAIEVDLLFTKDKWPVLSHYDTLPSRCSSAGKKIHLMTRAQLALVRCDDLDGQRTVPIADFYQLKGALAKNRAVSLTLDIKTYKGQSGAGKRDYAARAIWLLKKYGLLNRSRIITFSWSTVLPTIRKQAPKIYVLALDNHVLDLGRARKAARLGASGFGIKTKDTSASLLRYIKALGMDASPWEVKGESQRSFAIFFGGKQQLFSTDTPTRTRKNLVAGKYELDPRPKQVVTTLSEPATILKGSLKAKKKQYPRVLGRAVPAKDLMMLETVTLEVTITNGSGKGYVSVAPSGSLKSSEVRRKLPKGTKTFSMKVPLGDGGTYRVFTSTKASVTIDVVAYTKLTFAQ